ncbi:hypothetical protein M430DRAFT_41958 [Amorphotheca resinae ATCC 22711]|uniref:DUF676 domain-containing protein n=1 Tax=Amorphotheca resinae ATCC 22711 TaxID=857342 RepID=A0A2T3B4V2_AMORE|nr:hypothetical protein M430DRAFT_41958 [Amorphotheca resinae ATCC 22711]PSS20674.1 hypothetical protein M430DRAFT_41958 [Amorphotheca resinae ATCC 22711]
MGLFSKKRTSPPVQAAGYTASGSHQAYASASSQPRTAQPAQQFGLLPLNSYTAVHPSSQTYHIDVVAIHGLNGNAYTTWTNKRHQLWLQEFLPSALPGARIYTFSYDSRIFSRSASGINEFAQSLLSELEKKRRTAADRQRGIIFICHSLGGIVCKKALVVARQDPRYGNILQYTKAVLFFGTPHRGSDQASIGSVIFNIFNNVISVTVPDRYLAKARQDLVALLKYQNQTLTDLSEAFRIQSKVLEIVSFYESASSPPFNKLLVTRDSARIGVGSEQLVSLPYNHSDMCKIEDTSSKAYVILVHTCRKYGMRR